MSYFQQHSDKLTLALKSQEKDIGIRECQIGAYWATKAHFTADDSPALISLPTGAGKTSLMMLLALGMMAKRVLVVTPTRVLREQTFRKFKGLDGLKISKTVPEDLDGPIVHKQTSRVTSVDQWYKLTEFDVIVALPNVISTGYHTDIVEPPNNLFDLVFFDEAHHMRAPSWEKLLLDFRETKRVLLTATPFRRDRRRLPGRLVYFYPLTKAMQRGIYKSVKYQPVQVNSPAERDIKLRDKAHAVLSEERRKSDAVRLLIRTDSIEMSSKLVHLYRNVGLKVEAVHSDRNTLQNERTLEHLRCGDLDAVVAVGMLGEGLDVPQLKVAVFHAPPRSFPFTVQLIGRVARPADKKEISAHVVADPDQLREKGVEDEVRRLYRIDRGWEELIPDLVEQVAGSVLKDRRYGSSDVLLGVSIDDLRPFLSTRLYRLDEVNLKLDAPMDLGDDVAIYHLPTPEGESLLGLITESFKTPAWATKTTLEASHFDLHLYFYHAESSTLFECTTSDAIAHEIRSHLVQTSIERLGGDELVRVMQSDSGLDYIAFGLANAIGPTSAIPSYKIFLGRAVQGAVNPSDARVFTRGHVFAKMGHHETRGISDSQGRVWATKRASIADFIEWCKSIGNDLVFNKGAKTPTDFGFFSLPERLQSFPRKPVFALGNPEWALYTLTFYDEATGDEGVLFHDPEIRIGNFLSGSRVVLRVKFSPSSNADSTEIHYDIAKNSWIMSETSRFKVRVDDGYQYEDLKLQSFFERFPIWFYLPDGGVVKNGFVHRVCPSYDKLPASCILNGIDWSKCDITVEYEIPEGKNKRILTEGKKSVHDWLKEILVEDASEHSIIFKDHGSGEAADFIVFDLDGKVVKLYHCKGCPKHKSGPNKGKANIGATIEHLKEVVDQVVRSNVWIKTKNLLTHIRERKERDINPDFVVGEHLFGKLCASFIPVEWEYQVFIVNPGLDAALARDTNNANVILLTCYEWLRSTDCKLQIMGT